MRGFLALTALLAAASPAAAVQYVPECRKGHVADVWEYKGRTEMVIFGGKANAKESDLPDESGAVYLDDTWSLEIGDEEYKWREMLPGTVDQPEHRWKSAGGVLDHDELIVFGGHNGRTDHKDYLRDTWNYRESIGWEHVDASGTLKARRGHSAVIADQHLIVFGGKDEDGECLRDTWVLDFAEVGTKQWRETTLFPGECRWGHSASALLNADGDMKGMIVFGGREKISTDPKEYRYYNDLWIFDADDETWTQLNVSDPAGALPPARNHHASVHLHKLDLIVIYGGRDDASSDVSPLNDLWAYDVQAKTWTEVTSDAPAMPRFLHSMTRWEDGESVVIFGGETDLTKKGKHKGDPRHLNDVWMYNFNSGDWREVAKDHCDVYTPALQVLLSKRAILAIVGTFAGGALVCGFFVYWRNVHALHERNQHYPYGRVSSSV